MKIAIIGGGAAGMISAHLLCKAHDITVYERSATLGGNIQTLNLNAKASGLDKNIITENGVTGFHYFSQATFRKLITSLNIPIKVNLANVTTALYLKNNLYYEIPSLFTLKAYGLGFYLRKNMQLLKFRKAFRRAYKQVIDESNELMQTDLSVCIEGLPAIIQAWLRCTAMLAFSTPYSDTLNLPSWKLGQHYQNVKFPCWWSIPSGVYSYIQQILNINQHRLRYHCNAHIQSVERTPTTVKLKFEDGSVQEFDKVIFAIAPDQIYKLLAIPTLTEIENFKHWRSIDFKTIAHTDDAIYQGYLKPSKTVCDYFIKADNSFGYNTYINHIYDLPKKVSYNFSYNLDEYIAPQKILSEIKHKVPLYEHDTYQSRAKILALNGQNNSFFVGAYLGDGLQEGATQTALLVSKQLGGLELAR